MLKYSLLPVLHENETEESNNVNIFIADKCLHFHSFFECLFQNSSSHAMFAFLLETGFAWFSIVVEIGVFAFIFDDSTNIPSRTQFAMLQEEMA